MNQNKNLKDSGISWLGEIPQHWNDNHLKWVCKLIKDGTHASIPRVNNGYPLLSVRNIVDNEFRLLNDDSHISEKDYLAITKSFKVKEGDIQLAIVGATMGKVAIVPKLPPFATQRSIATIRTNSKYLTNKFLFYFIRSEKFQDNLWNNTNYSAQPGVYLGFLQTSSIVLPSLKEQNEITRFLDTRTKSIDKKIKLFQEKIAIYKEFRNSLIHETVTKGLNKKVNLNDSRIEWMGEIPEHWEIKRFKYFAKTIKGKSLITSEKHFDKSLPLITLEYLRNESVQHPTFAYSTDSSLQTTAEDFIIVWDGAAVGEILKAKEGYISSTIAKIKINKKLYDPKYFYHLRDFIDYTLKLIPTGMGIPHLNPNLLKNFKCPYPPLEEQSEIAEFLDLKTETIDKIVGNIKKQIKTLKELRKTLINDVVTGKIKVTD